MTFVSRSSSHAFCRLTILSPVFSLTALIGLAGCGQDGKLAVYNAEPQAEITAPVDGAAVLSGTPSRFVGRRATTTTPRPRFPRAGSSMTLRPAPPRVRLPMGPRPAT